MGIEDFQLSQVDHVRAGWKETIEQILAEHGHERLDAEWLDLPFAADEIFEW